MLGWLRTVSFIRLALTSSQNFQNITVETVRYA